MKKLILMLVPLMWSCYQGEDKHQDDFNMLESPRQQMLKRQETRRKDKFYIELRKEERLIESYYERYELIIKTLDTVDNSVHMYRLNSNKLVEEIVIVK